MKYLQDYVNDKQTKALDKADAFFAFSTKQYNEATKEGIKYANLGGGLICNELKAEVLKEELDIIYKDSIKEDIKENGITRIIKRELNNYEAGYTGEIDSTVDALGDYPVTVRQILKVFRSKEYREEYFQDNY